MLRSATSTTQSVGCSLVERRRAANWTNRFWRGGFARIAVRMFPRERDCRRCAASVLVPLLTLLLVTGCLPTRAELTNGNAVSDFRTKPGLPYHGTGKCRRSLTASDNS